jgi:hypothetical protein
MFNSSKPIGVREGVDVNKKYGDRVRVGKTAKDHKSGSWKSRFANRSARAEWQKNRNATNATFPG